MTTGTIVLVFGALACLCGLYGSVQTRRHIQYYPVQRLLFAGFSAWGGQVAVRAYDPSLLNSDPLRIAPALFMCVIVLWGAWLVRRRNVTPVSEDVTLLGRTLPLDRRTAERNLEQAAELLATGRADNRTWLEKRRAAREARLADAREVG